MKQLHDERSSVAHVLARPADERAREFKYCFAQSVVFGLPVLALHWLGPALGGVEAPRWTGLFRTLLAGWVMYVAAAGMMFEGAILLARRRRITPDFAVATIAAALYAIGVAGWAMLLVPEGPRLPMPFHYSVALLCGWCGLRWGLLSLRGAARKRETGRPISGGP